MKATHDNRENWRMVTAMARTTKLLLGGATALLLLGTVWARAQEEAAPRTRSARSLEGQVAESPRQAAPGTSFSEWQWEFRRFVNVGSAEPVALQESVRVSFANRGASYVRVTFLARSESGLPAGIFRGRKELKYNIEQVYGKVVIRGRRFIAQSGGPFKLVESDPPGHSLAEFSTLGGIARGKNMVAVVNEAFGGENLFSLDGANLVFVNQRVDGSYARMLPAQIVLEPVQ